MNAGADAYLSKPFSPLNLVQKMDEFLVENGGPSYMTKKPFIFSLMVLSGKEDKNRALIDVIIFQHLIRLPITSIS
jgi:DNA-binding response OmpR family regulator